ncbi:MAG: xylulokinase [Firmicutes bacterium]|nr:xylulokinase [Bacillota bacterium]
MGIFIGLDVGTSAVKALLLTTEGEIVGNHTTEYPLFSPQPGWSEQNPEDMWQASVEAIRGVMSKYAISPESVLGIGLSGQMHSSVFLDEHHEVIRPAILWNDVRTSAQCRLIERTIDAQLLLEEVCNPALEGFTLPKVLWLKEHEPENYAKLRCLLLPKDYVRFRLTGTLAMEVSDAAGMLMMNVRKQVWSKRILNALDINEDILPPIIGSSEIAGTLSFQAAEATGLKVGTPVVGGGADNACGAVGSGVVVPGRGMVSLGTSGVLLAHLAEPRLITSGTVHMFNSCVPREFYMMGVTLSAGLSLNWLRKRLGLENKSYDLMTKDATAVPPGSRGLVFLPYLTGERTPHGDANARGSFVGLSATHDQGELVRAVMEGVAFAFCDSLALLRSAGWDGTAIRALGGGARSPLWKEIIASATGLVLEEINIDEGPALGAAILAGVGTGAYRDAREASDAIIKVERTVEPNSEWSKIYADLYQVYKDLYPALKPSFDRLVEFS